MSRSHDAFPQVDLSDLRPIHGRQIFMVPFLGSGFTASGIYVRMGGGIRTCHNCEGSGLHFTLEGCPGECWRCNGSGQEKLGEVYPVLGRVLAAHPSCEDVRTGDVIVFPPQSYDWVHLDDGRSYCVIFEQVVAAIIDGYDTELVTIEPPRMESAA